ncbi:LysR family transcriptional regulator [Paraburkholderia sp.]|uniref:LysR family transcriptional regulator n=1 Tax=Paraburkholderia sp. TaxID=1926495 RepID=UPI003D7002C6
MNQIHAMRVFVSVAETESFRRAAQQLDVSNALVTRSIAMLEAHLHTRLIHRTTRNLSLTEAGVRYLEGCRELLEELDHLERAVADTEREPGGTLRVVAAGMLSPAALTPLVDGYRRHHPHVRVRLTLAERSVDLQEDGYDVGIVTAAATSGKDLVEHPLGANPLIVCAAPGYLAERGVPRSPFEFPQHAWVALPPAQRSPTWHFAGVDGHSHAITLRPAYTVNSMLMVRLAVLSGMGLAILPARLVTHDIETGTLVRVMPEQTIDDPEARVSIVYPGRRFLAAKTQSFIDHVVASFEGDLSLPQGLIEVVSPVSAGAPHTTLRVVPHA